MELIKYSDITSKSWNQYMEQLEGCSFSYLAENIQFQIEYAKNVIANESFILIVDKKIIGAACIYIYEDEKKQKSISWGGRYCPAPIVNQRQDYRNCEKYSKLLMEEIEKIQKKYNCRSVRLKFEPIGNALHQCKLLNYNYLLKYGYNDTSLLTQIIDLRLDEKEIYSEIRKGHKSDIKRGMDYTIRFYNEKNITEKEIELYREIYEYDAGMVTRNSEMYYSYYEFVKARHGVLAIAYKADSPVAVMIVTKFKNMAYYSSYAEKTDCLDGKPVGHVLQWEMMKYLKEDGIDFYEIGEQVFGQYDRGTEEAKLVNISTFKRGFGGYTVPMFRGIKEY